MVPHFGCAFVALCNVVNIVTSWSRGVVRNGANRMRATIGKSYFDQVGACVCVTRIAYTGVHADEVNANKEGDDKRIISA